MGCGACAAICPKHNIRLIDIPFEGLRPIVKTETCVKCSACIGVCPGVGASHQPFNSETIPQLRQAWGPVLEVWEGYATDPEIRFEGSSGGAATALALFCIERENFTGVLHIGAKPEAPLQNVPVFSKSREELLKCTGSRYSPAAPCEKLRWIEEAHSPCVFIGKPCDVEALCKYQAANLKLNDNVGLAISIFCAGTPTTSGTYKLLDAMGVEPEQIEEIGYRGRGWPGMTTVKLKGANGGQRDMSYEKSWGEILSRHVELRCRLCPDSTGEFADISCGDPWYRPIEHTNPGYSLVLVRTEKGQEVLKRAVSAGYVRLQRADASILPQSQKALLNKRCHLFGRLLAMQILLVPVPWYTGFRLFRNWLELSAMDKLHSIGGTLKRIILRGWMKPLKPMVLDNKTPESKLCV